MIPRSLRVRNFRCILDETLPLDELTVLAGPNGAGKSTFLRAFELFYVPTTRLSIEDFYAEDAHSEITVSVAFGNLTEEEHELFKAYLQGGELTVERVVSLSDARVVAKYHGSTLQHSPFSTVRDAEGAAQKRTRYAELRARPEYQDLPSWTNQAAALDALKEWEAGHPELCVRQRDEGQFFGFTEVGQGYLGRFTRLLFVPAVRDATEEASEARGSILTEIMDLVVRSVLARKPELKQLRQDTQAKYEEIFNPEEMKELQRLEQELSETLRTYVPDVQVEVTWARGQDIEIPLPKADVKLVEDGYPATVGRTGHGLQRAFILTMLQYLTMAQARIAPAEEEAGSAQAGMPNLVLAIEEPELYQHPGRQRRLAKTLSDLAAGSIPGVAARTQVVYSTHSPLFVGLDRFNQLRLLRKIAASEGAPKATRLVRVVLEEIAEEIWESDGRPPAKYTGSGLRAHLQAVMTPSMSEGFFAEAVVLVEGERDRAAILGMARAMGTDLEGREYAVIACGGKGCIRNPLVIFRKLGIPVYAIWDSDKGDPNAPVENHKLLRAVNRPEEAWPVTQVTEAFASFETTLDDTARGEIGEELFGQLLGDCQASFEMARVDHVLASQVAREALFRKAKEQGKTSPTLETIISSLLALKV